MERTDKFRKIRETAEKLDGIAGELEDIGSDMFGIIADIDHEGMAVIEVSRKDDSLYWQKIGAALSLMLTERAEADDPKVLATLVSALYNASLRSESVRDAVRKVCIPRLAEACGTGPDGRRGMNGGGRMPS